MYKKNINLIKYQKNVIVIRVCQNCLRTIRLSKRYTTCYYIFELRI